MMEEETTTAAAPEAVETSMEPAPAETRQEQPAEQQPAPPAQEEKPTPAPAKKSLLDDDPEPASEKPAGGEAAPEPSKEEVESFCKSIPALDLGAGVTWSDETLTAVAPAIMSLTGNDPKKAEPLVKRYADFMQDRARRAEEAEDAFCDGLAQQCRERWGEDFPKIQTLAIRGGREIFGDALWNGMKKCRQFANNPDVLERLARFGRSIANDTGNVTPREKTPEPDAGDVAHRMYGNIKI